MFYRPLLSLVWQLFTELLAPNLDYTRRLIFNHRLYTGEEIIAAFQVFSFLFFIFFLR